MGPQGSSYKLAAFSKDALLFLILPYLFVFEQRPFCMDVGSQFSNYPDTVFQVCVCDKEREYINLV